MNRLYELMPIDGRKSFYGKATVLVTDNGAETLFSYNTPIIRREQDGTLTPLYDGDKYGNTTSRHVKAFCGISKAQYMALLEKGRI